MNRNINALLYMYMDQLKIGLCTSVNFLTFATLGKDGNKYICCRELNIDYLKPNYGSPRLLI